MGFTPGQRPWSPWTSFGNWQGRYDEVADLPNAAASAYQPGVPNVQEGDIAWVDGTDAGLYVCTDPTAGAAIWGLLTTGGGVALSGVYTPVVTPTIPGAGWTAVPGVFTYTRIDRIVTVAGYLDVVNTVGASELLATIELPISVPAGPPPLAGNASAFELDGGVFAIGPVAGVVFPINTPPWEAAVRWTNALSSDPTFPYRLNVMFQYQLDP